MNKILLVARTVCFLTLFVSSDALGSKPAVSPFAAEELPSRLNPHSHNLINPKTLPAFPFSDLQVESFAKTWATALSTQFAAIRAEDKPSEIPACGSDEAFRKQRAAYVFGRYREVLNFADQCGTQLSRQAFRYAALSAIGLSETAMAEGYLRQAVAGLKTFSNDDIGTLLLWASWRLDPVVLDLNVDWTAREKHLYFTVIRLSNRLGLPTDVSMVEYRAFLDSEFSSPGFSGFKRDLLFSLEARRMFYEDDSAAFDLINRYGPQAEDPTVWMRVAYRVLFATPSSPTKMFRHADTVYRATWPYLHARSPLPTEDNVYTYTEIYDRECKSALLQGNARIEFATLKERWRNASIATNDFRNGVQKLVAANPKKSDLLVTLSTFAHMDGDLSLARDLAWTAHQLCPYFNRAALILTSLSKEESLRAETDYLSLEKSKIEDVRLLTIPSEISTYMVNWKQLTKSAQENLIWSIRGWLGYVPDLVLKAQASYVKFPFELMHEVPTLSPMKDTRSGYERDNRLWDDMRGIGGPMIVSDYFEAPQAPYGAYNLLEHEMAHQLDFYFEKEQPAIFTCIEKLFVDATRRNVFVTSYAKLRYEYFAVASESFFIPINYPLRFGVQRKWYEVNDRNLFDLLAAVTAGPAAAAAHTCAL